MRQRFLKATLCLAVIAAIAVANLPNPPTSDVLNDRQMHIIGFFAMTALTALAYPEISLAKILLAMILFGASIECVQGLAGLGRSANFNDWLADIAGALAALSVLAIWRWFTCLSVQTPE